VSLAAENAPGASVAAGPFDTIEALRATLEADGVAVRLLQTSHAFHSGMMDAAVAPFEAEVRRVKLSAPSIAIVSTLTGALLTEGEATDPRYWARHLREPVRFSPAVLAAQAMHPQAAFVELGPRNTLGTLVRQHASAGKPPTVAVPSLADTPDSEAATITLAHGRLWTLGIELPASAATPAHGRRSVLLPTYPFERKRHWVDAPAAVAVVSAVSAPTTPAAALAPAPTTEFPPAAPIAMSTTTDASPRRPRLIGQLRSLFEDVAGLDLAEADSSMNFVELGLDSLTLTQAAMQVKKQFKVALTFRQVMESYRSFDALAEFLDAQLPAEAAAAAAAAPAPVSAPAVAAVPMAAPMMMPVMASSAGAAAPQGYVQQLIQQQMQLMAQQLALLGGASPMVAAVPVVGAPALASAPAAAAKSPAAAAPAAAEEPSTPRYDVKKAFGAIARIHTQAAGLTDRQKARLDAFMRRYIERTKTSKAYTVQHRPHMADPRVVNGFRPMTKEITYQIVIDRSKGSRVWDLDGHEYVDTLNGFGMNLFGWQPDFIVDAVKAQIDKGYEIGPQHPLAGEVCQLICELTGSDRAAMCNTGSEAVMAAVRIARTVTGRSTVVLFTGSYHGTFDEVLVRAGRNAKGISAAPGILSGAFGDVRVLDYGTPEALQFIRDNADDLAAVLVEPVQSRRPEFQPLEFLKEVRTITEASGTCFIFDEVITGFRAHIGGAQAHFGIRADLASYGKVIGGGMPIGVVAGKREYMDALDGGAWDYGDDSMPTVGVTYFAGTFVRHPLALAAAKASLEHLKAHGAQLQTQLNTHIAAMANELTAFCREVGAPLEIRHFASLWRVAWLEDHPLQDLLFAMMRSRGVHILDNFPNFMTTSHTPQDIALVKQAFKESIAELQEAEFLPRKAVAAAVLADASAPPVPGAKLGRDKDGRPAWFVPDANAPGKFLKVHV
jgi:glutamate-1-semialdehyde aminotransferase/malonyl CoA-acyl carrier protein transacylase